VGDQKGAFDVNRIRIVTAPNQGDAGVIITAAELHPEWLVLNYISRVPQDELARGLVDGQPKRFDVTDDLGTAYEINGGSGGGEATIRRMDVKLVPAVPSEAKSLRVTLATGVVVITL
jgi:hypothetical protein